MFKYTIEQQRQLYYLKLFLSREGRLHEYESYLKDLTSTYTSEQLEQFIKCIVHYLPYTLLNYKSMSAQAMNEVRRYTEDVYALTLNDSGIQKYMELGEKLLDFTQDHRFLYQFRRLLKYKVGFTDMERVLDLFITYLENSDWFMACYLIDSYFKYKYYNLTEVLVLLKEYTMTENKDAYVFSLIEKELVEKE